MSRGAAEDAQQERKLDVQNRARETDEEQSETERLLRALQSAESRQRSFDAGEGANGNSRQGMLGRQQRQYWRKLKQLLKVDADAIVARTTAARWASFAKTGDPNYEVCIIYFFRAKFATFMMNADHLQLAAFIIALIRAQRFIALNCTFFL